MPSSSAEGAQPSVVRPVAADHQRGVRTSASALQEDIHALLLSEPADEEKLSEHGRSDSDPLGEAFHVNAHRNDRLRDGIDRAAPPRRERTREAHHRGVPHDHALEPLQAAGAQGKCIGAVHRHDVGDGEEPRDDESDEAARDEPVRVDHLGA